MKCYAVKKGRTPGIYFSWEKTREQIHKYPGAVFKSFEDMDAAREYINREDPSQDPIRAAEIPTVYIDGSYNKARAVYSYGGFIRTGKGFRTIQGTGNEPDYLKERNIAGELIGALEAIREAARLQLSEILLVFDYEGIQAFVTGEWKAKTPLTRYYHQEAQRLSNQVQIYFQYVQGHTGNTGNELADILAKEAAGAKLRKKDIKALEEYRKDPGAYFLQAEDRAAQSTEGQ